MVCREDWPEQKGNQEAIYERQGKGVFQEGTSEDWAVFSEVKQDKD